MIFIVLALAVYAKESIQIGEINLTIWNNGNSKTLYDENMTVFYANYSNITSGTIVDADCILNITNQIKNLTYNLSSGLYEFETYVSAGNYTYNISCNKTGYPSLSAEDNLTIKNRNPQLAYFIPNITIAEDNFIQINLKNYFYDPDATSNHSENLVWNYTDTENITISLNNQTGMMNITPEKDFYGLRTIKITAIDLLNATADSNLIYINITNTPEVNLSSPLNESSGFYANSSITFKVQVQDDYEIDNCSLFINDALNQTNTNINFGNVEEAKNDSGEIQTTPGQDNIINFPGNGIITEKLNLAATDYSTLKVYLSRYEDATNELIVKINNQNLFNISPNEVKPSGGWVTKTIDNSVLIIGKNNFSFEAPYIYGGTYYAVHDDGHGEYLVRLTNILEFEPVNLTKGEHSWKVNCSNEKNQSKQTKEWFLTVNNSAPTAPTILTPTSGTFGDDEDIIEINCGGSTDIDGDSITYLVEYSKDIEDWHPIFENDNGTYQWNISQFPAQNIILRCLSSDRYDYSDQYLPNTNFDITIDHPGAPSQPSQIICNDGSCEDQTFEDTIEINCSGSTDTDSSFNYAIQAYYEDYEGIKWRTLAEVPASEGTSGFGIHTWDTSVLMNQTNVKIGCYATDGINANSSKLSAENITISHLSAPNIPTNLKPQSGTFQDEINISCNGSGDITYEIYGNYNDKWNLVNDSLTQNEIYKWNTSIIPEQNIKLKCRASDNYYSKFTPENIITIDRAPTKPTSLKPETQNHEYEINYSCSGSNNSNYFLYYIETNQTGNWELLTDSFPGISQVNDSKLAEDDGVTKSGIVNFEINLELGKEYYYCSDKDGVSLSWDCDTFYRLCDYKTNNLIPYQNKYCAEIIPTEKYFKINTNGKEVDHITFIAKPFTWNVSGISPQKNVDLRCTAYDSVGNSTVYNPAGTFSIDREPDFTGPESLSLNQNTKYTYNLSDWFADEDKDSLEFSITNASNIFGIINGKNITVWANTCEVNQDLIVSANDSIVTTSQDIRITTSSCPRGGGKSSPLSEEKVEVAIPAKPEETKTEPEPEPEPMIEQPKEIKKGSSSKASEDTISVIQKIFDTQVRHTREYVISRSKTKIIEKIKNIGFYNLEETRVRVIIPKTVAESASEIETVDSFIIIKEDPEIEFTIQELEPDGEIKLQYIIDKRLSEQAIRNIAVQITPKEITEEEKAKREEEVKRKIENTSKYVGIKKQITTTKDTTEFKIQLDIDDDTILYDVSIFAEIPKCLVEIIEREMIESDVDFEIIAADPLIRWHFETLTSTEEINYLIKRAADEECADKTIVMPLAHKILLTSRKIDFFNALIPLIIVPIIILVITFFSEFSYSEKEKLLEIEGLIKWAKRTRKQGYRWSAIKESLKRTRKYSEEKIKDVIMLASRPFKLLITKLDIDIEEGILILIIILNILDFARFLPGEVDFAKKIISWTILGYLLFRISITRVLFGCRCKMIDILLLAGHFMLIVKNIVHVAETEFIEAGYLQDLYALIANNAQTIENTFFTMGAVLIIGISIYISTRIKISEKSFLGVIKEFGPPPKNILKILSRSFFVFITHLFFFLVVFNLMMEWLAIAVDAAIVTLAVFFYLFVLIKHREKHWMLKIIYKIGNVGEKFYENFIELFQNRKTILIGLSGILILHTLTEIGIFILPYTLGLYNPLYLASWEIGHAPIFNMYGWLRGSLGIKTFQIQSLFAHGTVGFGTLQSMTLIGMYILNIIAITALLALPALVWYHLYKNRKKPVSEVPKFMLPRWSIAILVSSFIAYLFAPAFKLKGLFLRGLLGVDIITINIAKNPNLDLIFAISIVAGLLAYFVMHLARKSRDLMSWTILASSFVFFIYYIVFFFRSIVSFYSVSIRTTLIEDHIFISFILLTFMALTILFYGFGSIALIFELWMRNELQLRKILKIKKLPEWAKHFDMAMLHHESEHKEHKHGKKFELLKKYLLKEMKRGHKFSTILNHIIKVGWKFKIIKEALEELSKNKEFIILTKHMKRKNEKSISKLSDYISKEIKKGVPGQKIIKTIKKAEWNDIDIFDAVVRL